MSEPSFRLTIYTPAYNRDALIPNVYHSLCAQSCKDFEWLVLDQGHDQTETLVRQYQQEAPFPVVYHRIQGERGVARAINAMLEIARGELVMKLDDDDVLTPDAVEKVYAMVNTLPEAELDRYAGVSGLRMYPDGTAIGQEWSNEAEYVDCTNLERYKYGLPGDKAEVYFLKVLQAYGPIPTFPGEPYAWESVLWDRIAHAGKLIRWFNQKIYITEYLPGGMTRTRDAAKINNFRTFTLCTTERLCYPENSFGLRVKVSCRYFEIYRKQKQYRLRDIRPFFKHCRLLGVIGYLGSPITRFIPEHDE